MMELSELDNLHSEFFPTRNSCPSNQSTDANSDNSDIDESDSETQLHLEARVHMYLDRQEYTNLSDDENDDGEEGTCSRLCNYNTCDDDAQLRALVDKGCGCIKTCIFKFTFSEIKEHVVSLSDMTKDEKEIYIMAKLKVKPQRKKQKETENSIRKRLRYTYEFKDVEVCRYAFMITHNIGEFVLKSIIHHLLSNGLVPRNHGNKHRRPPNAYSFDILRDCAQFILNYAEEHGLPQPAAVNRNIGGQILLPCCENKQSLHKKYKDVCTDNGRTAVGLTTFKGVWQNCCPYIKFMSPKTDVCPVCERHKDNIQSASTEDEKLAALDQYSAHLNTVKAERQLYNQCISDARAEIAEQPVPLVPVAPMSSVLKKVHYTFDYSQAVSIPHHVCQVGPLYFATPRKVQLFGVAMEGLRKQYNFLVDEDSTPGENGTKIKGAIGVISMLHYCLENFGCGEKECHLHCDNASGENKNRFMLAYLLWRVLSGKHEIIHLHMQVPYHGKSLVDAGFAYIKKLYRRSEVDSLDQLANVVRRSSTSNEVVVFGGTEGHWLDWKTFTQDYFLPFKGIRKYRHFVFKAENEGIIEASEAPESAVTKVKLLKPGVDIGSIQPPVIIPAAGLSADRQKYLYKFIRPFVRCPWKDAVAPPPEGQEE